MDQSSEPESPFYFFLVNYQDYIGDEKFYQYKRTVEKINDGSRLEDASLFITDLEDEYQCIHFHAIEIIRGDERINVLDDNAISINQREASLEPPLGPTLANLGFAKAHMHQALCYSLPW